MGGNQIVSKLETIKNKGSVKDIDFLFKCLLSENSEIVKKSFDILVDIKVKSANKLIIEKINDKEYNKILNLLVSLCWQSGLDFSDNVLLFYNIVINEDLLVSIEAMSVIENIISNNNVSKEIMDEGMKMLNTYIKTSQDEVKTLMISDFINTYI